MFGVTKMWPMSSPNLSLEKRQLRRLKWTKKAKPGPDGHLSLAKGILQRRGSWNYYVGFSWHKQKSGTKLQNTSNTYSGAEERALQCAWSSQELRAEPASRDRGSMFNIWELGTWPRTSAWRASSRSLQSPFVVLITVWNCKLEEEQTKPRATGLCVNRALY